MRQAIKEFFGHWTTHVLAAICIALIVFAILGARRPEPPLERPRYVGGGQ